MNTTGHFRITRNIFELGIFKNQLDFRLFFTILGQAVFKDDVKVGADILKRGEWLRSYRQLKKDMEYIDGRTVREYGIATIKRSIERLIAERLIETRIGESGTVFKVLQYNEWQGIADLPERKEERNAEHQPGTKRIKSTTRIKDLQELKTLAADDNTRARGFNFFDPFYLAYGYQPTPNQIMVINSYIDQDGLSEELFLFGLQKASMNSKNFKYFTSILNNWIAKGITTTEQAQQESERRDRTAYGQQAAAGAATSAEYQDIGLDW